MNRILTAIALSIALPAVAHAQSTPEPKQDCCDKMKAEGKECCCKDMAGNDHAKHDEAKPADHEAHQH